MMDSSRSRILHGPIFAQKGTALARKHMNENTISKRHHLQTDSAGRTEVHANSERINIALAPREIMRDDAPGRIHIEQRHHHSTYHLSKNSSGTAEMNKFESTSAGDVVTVEESYDEDAHGSHDHAKGDENNGSIRRPVHRRDLSAHFFDATRLTDHLDEERDKREYPSQHARPQRGRDVAGVSSAPRSSPSRLLDGGAAAFSLAANAPPMSPAINVGNKHRRGPSGGFSNRAVAHRRINSIGDSAQIDRYGHYGGYQYFPSARPGYHRREDSAGLDILSAVADESKEQLEMAAGNRRPGRTRWEVSEPNPLTERRMDPPQKVASTASYEYHPGPHARYSGQYAYGASHSGHPSMHYYNQDQYHPPHGPPQAVYHHSSQRSPTYPLQYAPLKAPHQYPKGPHDGEKKTFSRKEGAEWRGGGTTIGSQTFVTAIGADDGNCSVMAAPVHRNTGTNTEVGDNPQIPTSVGHHRKLSSYSSLGALLGSALFPDPEHNAPNSRNGSHHRSTSSSVSLLQGLDGDMFFLQNLQASTPHGVYNTSFANPRPAETASHQVDVVSSNEVSGHSLAEGGTSKRIRRKCTVGDCANRVVQGGLCISHGAKRKICQHPGCNKNVKKCGMCSTHGPARKRCENRGCGKVAVQGGKCIAHGAKKKLCETEGCTKQAILTGMCKKHHDAANGILSTNHDGESCILIDDGKSTTSQSSDASRPSHNRGLSIFQEISAESVHTLLSAEEVEGVGVHPLKSN